MKDFFGKIKWSQILAGALAAVTSFLLMNKIGIAGSVIGAAVASIVTALATQAYQSMLEASHDTVHRIAESDEETAKDADGKAQDGQPVRKPRAAVGVVDPYATGVSQPEESEQTQDSLSGDSTADAASDAAHGDGIQDEDFAGFASVTETAPTQVLPDAVRSAAVEASLEAEPTPMQQRRGVGNAVSGTAKARDGRRRPSAKTMMFVVALVCSLVAVAVTAAVISLATGGKGLGDRPAVVQQQTETPGFEAPSSGEWQTDVPSDDESALDNTDSPTSATESTTADATPSTSADASESASSMSATESPAESSTPSVAQSPSSSQSASASPSASQSASPSASATPSASASPTASAKSSANADSAAN